MLEVVLERRRAKLVWGGLVGDIAKDGTLQKKESAPRHEESFWTMNAKAITDPPRILRVGLRYGLPEVDGDDFYTDTHFLDYDIVIMDPQGALIARSHDYTDSIRDDVLPLDLGAEPFLSRYERVTQKLVEFVNAGGLAVIFLRAMPTLNYEVPGKYESSLVTVSLDKHLPWRENTIHRAHGSNIEFTTQGSIGRFWESTNGFWHYEAVYDDPPVGQRLAHVKGHPDEVVANLIMTEKRGRHHDPCTEIRERRRWGAFHPGSREPAQSPPNRRSHPAIARLGQRIQPPRRDRVKGRDISRRPADRSFTGTG